MWWKQKSGAAGDKRGRGRPRRDGGAGGVEQVTVMLTPIQIDRALRAGGGNLSLGVRKLLDVGIDSAPLDPL